MSHLYPNLFAAVRELHFVAVLTRKLTKCEKRPAHQPRLLATHARY